MARLLPSVLIAAILSFMVTFQSATAQVSTDERAALVALYQSTNGEGWIHDTNWMGDEGTECQWFGVNCFDHSVISINLSGNNLSGELPPAITDLQSLRFLHLRGNNIGGGLPDWLADLPSLEALDLGHNPLGGNVPGSLLSSFSLTHIWLDNCQLDAISDDIIGEQGMLLGLWLNDNSIAQVPGVISSLHQLRHLSLRNNLIAQPLPESVLTAFHHLLSLDIGHNPMTELPAPAIASLPSLQFLDARFNQAGDNLSDWFDQAMMETDGTPFPSLYWLNLQGNLLSGNLPTELFGQPMLSRIWLDDNQLSGPLPETLFTNPALQVAMLSGNQLSGELPDPDITEWPSSIYSQLYIDLRYNSELSGLFPESLVYRTLLDRLQTLHSGTNLEFGDCYGLRQVSTLEPPLAYDPDEPVEVTIWMRNRAWPGSPGVVDTIPEHWDVIPDPDCFCMTEEPTTVHSAPVTISRNTVFRYQLQGPQDPLVAEVGHFDGILSSAHPNGDTRLICGDSRGWIETIYFDAFGI